MLDVVERKSCFSILVLVLVVVVAHIPPSIQHLCSAWHAFAVARRRRVLFFLYLSSTSSSLIVVDVVVDVVLVIVARRHCQTASRACLSCFAGWLQTSPRSTCLTTFGHWHVLASKRPCLTTFVTSNYPWALARVGTGTSAYLRGSYETLI